MSGTRARIRVANGPVDGEARGPWAARIALGPRPHPRDELDRGQHDERDPMAHAARDEALEQVVGRRREAGTASRPRTTTSEPAGRDEPEGRGLRG